MLLEAGCDPSITDKYGKNVLSYLAEYGHDDAAKLLLEAKPNLDLELDLEYVNPKRNETVLMIAARHGHLEMVRLLLDKEANPIHEMAHNREYKKSLAIRILAEMILARGNDEAERMSELNPSATLTMHDWNVEHHFSPLTCAMSPSNNEDTQKQIVKLIYQKICEIDTENKFKKAINRFKAGPSEEGEGCQCPISGATNEPVMLVQTAQIYDRHAIDDWLSSEKSTFQSNRTCPVTNEYLYSRTVIPLRYFE